MARNRGNYTQGGERVGRSKMVVGGKVSMPDGTIGTVQRVFGDSKSRRAVVVTEGGSYNLPVSQLKPTAGRPQQQTVRSSTGTLDPEVARGEKPDSKGKYRTPMPEKAFQRLQAMGVIAPPSNPASTREGSRRMAGAASAIDKAFIDDGGKYSKGGFVHARRKGTFKGTF